MKPIYGKISLIGALAWLAFAPAPALAHGGEDHGGGAKKAAAEAPGPAPGGGESQFELKIETAEDDPLQGGPAPVEAAKVKVSLLAGGAGGRVITSGPAHAEEEVGVYGFHHQFAEPGSYLIRFEVSPAEGQPATVEFPVVVRGDAAGGSPLRWIGLGALVLLLLLAVWLFSRVLRRRRKAVATAAAVALIFAGMPPPHARANGGDDHGAPKKTAPSASAPAGAGGLVTVLGPEGKQELAKTAGALRYTLTVKQEAPPAADPNVVSLSENAVKTIGIKTVAVAAENVAEGVTTTGEVQANPNGLVRVSSRVSGRVLDVRRNIGDPVRAGEVLATVDSTEITEAQGAYQQALSVVRQAYSGVAQAQSVVRRAQAGVSEADAEVGKAQAEQRKAESDVEKARSEIRVAEAKVDIAQKSLTRQKQFAAAGAFNQAPLQAAKNELSAAQSELLQAQAALTNDEAQFRRLEAGFEGGVVALREVDTGRAAVAQSRARLDAAASQLRVAKETVAREERILRENLLNSREVQQAEGELDTARLGVQSQQAELEMTQRAVNSAAAVVTGARSGVRAAQAQVAGERSGVRSAQTQVAGALKAVRSAELRLRVLGVAPGGGSRVDIRAPLSGVVSERPVNSGETVEAGKEIYTLVNPGSVWVAGDLYEQDLRRVRLGQQVIITTDALPGRKILGSLSYISSTVDPENRTAHTRTQVTNPGGVLKPGMFVKVLIASAARPSLVVPRSALQEDGAEKVVFVAKGATFTRRPVQAGAEIGRRVAILSGLEQGETVVTEGAYQLLAAVKQQR